jgi:hypothetical protein
LTGERITFRVKPDRDGKPTDAEAVARIACGKPA